VSEVKSRHRIESVGDRRLLPVGFWLERYLSLAAVLFAPLLSRCSKPRGPQIMVHGAFRLHTLKQRGPMLHRGKNILLKNLLCVDVPS
jgi:hypothetical protein